MTTTQQQESVPVHALVAGKIKLCPICFAVRDTWTSLDYHVTEHHDRELAIPDDAED